MQFSTVWNPTEPLKEKCWIKKCSTFKDLSVSYENHKRSNAGFFCIHSEKFSLLRKGQVAIFCRVLNTRYVEFGNFPCATYSLMCSKLKNLSVNKQTGTQVVWQALENLEMHRCGSILPLVNMVRNNSSAEWTGFFSIKP